MAAGKGLAIVGGILTLVATFVLSIFQISSGTYGWGLGFVLGIVTVFTNPGAYPIDPIFVYILAVVFILFLISGILQLVGVKSRATAIIGSILPLAMGVFILLFAFTIVPGAWMDYFSLLEGPALIEGIIPFHFDLFGLLGFSGSSIGTLVLLVGGLLGLISGFMKRW